MRFLLVFEFIITTIQFWNLCEHVYCLFLVLYLNLVTATNLSTQIIVILMLNESNFKI